MHFVVSLGPKAQVWLGIRRPRNVGVAGEVAKLDSKPTKTNLVKGTGVSMYVCVCMYVCMCMCMCVCVCACACIYVYVCMYACIYMCVSVYPAT